MAKARNSIWSILTKHGIIFSIFFILALILVNSIITFQYKKTLDTNQAFQKSIEDIILTKKSIISNLNTTDMSIRGYLLVKNEVFLDTYFRHKNIQLAEISVLNRDLTPLGFNLIHIHVMEQKLKDYYQKMDKAIELDKNGATEKALEIIKEDHGTAVWQTYVKLGEVIDPFLSNLQNEKQASYNRLLSLNLLFNIILFIIGIPTLLFAAYRLWVNAKRRNILYQELDNNNRQLIFNSLMDVDLNDEGSVVGSLIENLKKTAHFIKEIAKGNYTIDWEGLDSRNKDLNQNNIAAELLMMRDQMKKRVEEVSRQSWVNEGLAKFSEMLREHQSDLHQSADKTLSYIVKYLNAQQGGLFVVRTDESTQKDYLELISSYAFNRKKFRQKRIEIGEGILGQAYLEAAPIYLNDLPEDYISITSGLGDARPRCLMVFPLMHNDKVEAIIEIASFVEYDKFALEFLENASKTLASSITTIKINQRTQKLLENSQQQAEQMRAQEEEMRQNMEELEATQEEMLRKEAELKKLLEKYSMSDEQSNLKHT